MVPIFPCDRLPEDPAAGRLVGLYPQRQEGLWLQRLKNPGGVLTADQWAVLAQAARDFTPDTPLHITTRQDIEFHNLPAETVPLVQARVASAGMTSAGAAGDTPRNTTVCSCSGLMAGAADLHPLAAQLGEVFLGIEGIYALPRKFKVALMCGPDCGRPWINDLSIIAKRNEAGELGFTVIVAGSLGAKPGTGLLLHEWLPAQDVLPLATALIEVFAAHGDRENRRKARLRHVRERMGDAVFAALVAETFAAHKARTDLPAIAMPAGDAGFGAMVELAFPFGNLSADTADAIGRLTRDGTVAARMNVQQGVTVFGADQALLDAALAAHGLSEFTGAKAIVMTCPGTRWCKLAKASTETVAAMLRPLVEAHLPTGGCACVSGCPNGCSHYGVADVGLFGLASTDGVERYNVFVGGGNGKTPALAAPLAQRVTAEEAVAAVALHFGA